MDGVSQDEARGVKEIGCHLEKDQSLSEGLPADRYLLLLSTDHLNSASAIGTEPKGAVAAK